MIPITSIPTHVLLLFTCIISLLFSAVLLIQILKALISYTGSRRPAATRHLPPGSSGLPLIGETPSFLAANSSSRGFYEFVRARRSRYGNCFKTNIFGKTHVFVSSTGAAKAVLGNDFVGFTKRYIRSIAELLGEQSLLCTSAENHRHLRRRMSGLFNTESLASSVRVFDGLTVEALRDWKPGEPVVVFEDALKITFRAICKMLMSSAGEHELGGLQKDVFEVTEAMLAFPLKIPGSRFLKGLRARRRIMSALKKMIYLRREGIEYHEDFLQSLLTRDGDSSNSSLTDSEIQDNILTLIIAGQITTASAITWMVKYLDENQDVQEKLRELYLPLACSSSQVALSPETFREMAYGSKVVKEALRMATIVSWFPRIALEDCEIEGNMISCNIIQVKIKVGDYLGIGNTFVFVLSHAGFQIKRGWIVNVDARYIHSDAIVYKDPAKFYPSRFDEDPKPYSFLAFGTGERTCLGMNLAKAMMLVFLHRLVTTFRWKLIDQDMSLERHALFPRLRSGCPIIVTPIRD